MSNTEQRLTDLELDVTELRHNMRAGRVGALSDAVSVMHTEMNQRFDQVDQRFERVEQRFDQVDQRFERVEGRLDEHGQLLREILGRLPERE
jgi:Tfp pilus assembly protein PilN